jgi:hypothetical protein
MIKALSIFNKMLIQESKSQATVDIFPELNPRMSTVRLMEKLLTLHLPKLSSEEWKSQLILSTILP